MLADFLAHEAGQPPYPGGCCRMADRWFALRCGFSPLAAHGPAIDTPAAVDAALDRPGGIVAAVCRVMREAGCRRTTRPAAGDVGIVRRGGLAYAAIFDGQRWHSRDDRGFVVLPATAALVAWSVPNREGIPCRV